MPGARGVYLTADGAQVTEITRGGYTGQIEELLIGTLYSQYARRHVTLSGRLLASSQVGGLCVYFDRCMTDARLVPETNGPTGANQQVMPAYGYKAFVMSSSAEDVRAGTTEIEVTEFTLDEYVKVETDDNEEEEQ